MTKNKPTFNTNAQQLLVIFSFVSLIVSVMGPISAGTDGTGLGLGPILLSLVTIPFAVGIGAMGIALTIKTDRSIRTKTKKPMPISKTAGLLLFFYIIVILMPFVLLLVTASA